VGFETYDASKHQTLPYMQLFFGLLIIFLHMGYYLDGVQRANLLVLLALKKLDQLGYNIVASNFTLVIDDFCQLTIHGEGRKMYLDIERKELH